MQEYEDPQQHLERHLKQAAEKYAHGLEQAGLEPNDTLTRAMSGRALQEARESYNREVCETHFQNVQTIMHEHDRRMNEIKREGARMRLMTCPPIAIFFAAIAWYCFSQPNGLVIGIILAVGALAFIAMLIGGAIFDRPS